MATSPYLSITEYLNTDYDPDLEYVDGQLVERNVGKWEHARIQALLGAWFCQHEDEWKIQTATDLRTRVARTRVRLPDVLLVGLGPQPPVIDEHPVLAVEILSDGDTLAATKRKCDEYIAMGTKGVWIINPVNRTAFHWLGADWKEAARLEVPGTPIYVESQYLWEMLDRAARARE
ncbi:MAG: Uma2 family endonuclease [Acidobacteriaceae bacterium]|nr:Uma2 family endonuclease [Acidobacteriaceae bacterium]